MELTQVKLEIFVPEGYLDTVWEAWANVGADRLDAYTHGSSAYAVTGTRSIGTNWLLDVGAIPKVEVRDGGRGGFSCAGRSLC